ncbi:M14 metallopeptidase family protein [Foetidibacter luteolus]|uniref:M14 metallopeptidase family protein n=1 Tax=Foetidibacter luteolus TaxID=2608880 RepID=UPI00129A1FD9|nr:M14 metallopeptidase family protein [Foetidibacter luteolus]
MKQLLLLLATALLNTSISFAQTLQSPDDYLGYKIGTRYTRHHKIVEYFNAVAQARPDMVKIEKYGATNEGRDLVIAFIALPENLQKLDAIRLNNLRLAGLTRDKAAPVTEGSPAIVWLSYNVHGNEPASSEAALKTLYALVDPSNTQTKEWLKNTVVIIDPCINPDGRDRYVNWYNSMVGMEYNPDPQSREHIEPWPQGRTNHYNFDLNRDWAWQTQVETQQRIKKYNEWMPQVHVDFHEQGYNTPYYFAPAAEPYHEVITQWQRDFQALIGRNNAKYFDANGWLYFTKERFDLFYPSYGDTYPLYNGAIGMTFEQGGIRGGLGIKNNEDDTLTLVDRATHHYTTGLSTVETASKNAAKLVTEYKKFFDDTRNAAGSIYKTYVLTSPSYNTIAAVAKLLDGNGIEYGTISNTGFKGYNYFTGKEETFSSEGYQVAVSAYQPRGAMARVLFEPTSKLNDSVTYDITAWSLPYVYGAKAYASKEKLDIAPFKQAPAVTKVSSSYGLLIPYNSFDGGKLLAYLLKNKVRVRVSDKAFTYKDKLYKAGTLIVLKGNNVANWNEITNNACAMFNLQPEVVESGFMDKGADFGSPDIRFVKAAKVALVTGEQTSSLSAGEVWHFFDQVIHYPLTLVNANDLGRISLKNYDVLIMPDGNYRALDDDKLSEKLKQFVNDGGKIVAMENAVNQMAEGGWGLKIKEDKKDEDKDKDNKEDTTLLKKYAERERDELPNAIPGAIFKVQLDNSHPLAFGYPSYYYTLKQDGNIYEYSKEGWNVGTLSKTDYVAGFVGSKLKPKIKNGLIFGVQNMGNGSVVYLADDVLFRSFWENGKLLFTNAVFIAGE